MGEAKRKRDKLTPAEQAALDVTRTLANQGRIVAGGLAAYCILNDIKPGDPRVPLVTEVFYSGAEHVFSSILAALDPGLQETDADIERMDKLHRELMEWRKTMEGLRYAKPEGAA